MKVYVYVSDATEQTVISMENHGKYWELKDGEVYDLMTKVELEDNVIVLDKRPGTVVECSEQEFDMGGEL